MEYQSNTLENTRRRGDMDRFGRHLQFILGAPPSQRGSTTYPTKGAHFFDTHPQIHGTEADRGTDARTLYPWDRQAQGAGGDSTPAPCHAGRPIFCAPSSEAAWAGCRTGRGFFGSRSVQRGLTAKGGTTARPGAEAPVVSSRQSFRPVGDREVAAGFSRKPFQSSRPVPGFSSLGPAAHSTRPAGVSLSVPPHVRYSAGRLLFDGGTKMSTYLGGLPSIAPARAQATARRHGPRQRWARDTVRRMTQVAMLKHAARLGQPIPAIGGPEFRALERILAEAAEAGRPVVFVSRSGVLLPTTVDQLISSCNRAIHIGPGTDDADRREDL